MRSPARDARRSRASGHAAARSDPLSPQAELGYQGPVALNILAAKVVEETAPLTNHHEQAPATVVVALVESKMLRQVVDALGEQGDLHLG